MSFVAENIKPRVHNLPHLAVPHPKTEFTVQTNSYEIGYDDILK